MAKNIKEMSVEELKALAYDFMVDANRLQQNLQAINAELATRKPTPEKEPEKE